jgi:uncharacterized protein YndB with AHSA1/START domain
LPITIRTRTIAMPPREVWELVSDPHHLPRWWPRVARVEGVEEGAYAETVFTEVLSGRNGRVLRADFAIILADPDEMRLRWMQLLRGTPFESVLTAAETDVRLSPNGQATDVTVELRQCLRGVFPRLGSRRIAKAAAATITEALNGLDRIAGPGAGQGRQA